MTITELAQRIHQAARLNGWWADREQIIASVPASLRPQAVANIRIAALGLIQSEAGEAIDNVRLGCQPDDKLPQYPGAAVEVADVIIRCLDLAEWEGWPIAEIIESKLAKNRERGIKHGGKLA